MPKKSKIETTNEVQIAEAPVPVKVCPKCKVNPRAITRSGRLSGLCKGCNVLASKASRAKLHPSRDSQKRDLVRRALELAGQTGKKPTARELELFEILLELSGIK